MLETIVAGYAGDQAGRDAVALAGRIAAIPKGEIVVAFPYHPLLAKETSEQAEERVRSEVGELLEGIAGAEATSPPVCHWSPSSWPIRALHELAEYEHANLIVLGAAREDLGDRIRVSLMERMVHGAPCAVAVAPTGYSDAEHELRRIGVGFASSKEGRMAIELARELAGRVGGSVEVIAGAGLEPALASYAFSSPALGEVEAEIYADTERTLKRVCGELGQHGDVKIGHETIRGEPAEVLVERSSELDLLVLGSRAYGPLRHALLGSVSARAMREAKCPVLVVPRGVGDGDGLAEEPAAGAVRDS